MPEPRQRDAISGLGYRPSVTVLIGERIQKFIRMLRAEIVCEMVASSLQCYGHELIMSYTNVLPANAARLNRVPVAFALAPLPVFVCMVALEKLSLDVFNRHPSPHVCASSGN